MVKTRKWRLAVLIMALGFQCVALAAGPGRITVEGTQLRLAGKQIYMNAGNTPWDNWDDFGSLNWRNYDRAWWEAEFARMNAKGINSTRVWISCSGDALPFIDSNGYVTGVSQQFWNDLDHYMGLASKYKVYVLATMMSFDHVKNTYTNYQRWRTMFSSQDRVRSMVDKYIVPFVTRYKDNPYLYAIDLCNEPEWMNENSNCGNIPVAQIQRYAAMAAAGIHRSGSEVLVTIGSACAKWNSDKYNGNYWSDAKLKAQYNDAQAYLDFYQIHYYLWMEPYFPLLRSPANHGMTDRPVIIGEMPARDDAGVFPSGLTMTKAMEGFLAGGYSGHYPWTTNGVDSQGSLNDFGADALAFRQAHATLCDPLTGYLVVYNPNEASGGAAPQAQAKAQNASITLAVNSGTLAKAGYTFAGWNTAMDGSGTNYPAGAAYAGNGNLTLFAKWTTGTPTYTVAYNANGATSGAVPASQTKTKGVNLTLASNSGNLSKTSSTFAGWNTASNGGGTSYATGATYSADADVTLYAKWASVPTYALTVNNGSGDGSYTQGSVVSIAADVPANYNFVNWTGDTSVVADKNLASTTITMPAAAVTVTANVAIDTHTVTFVEGANGTRTGGGALVQTVDHGSAAVAPTISANTGYTFDGWDVAFNTVTSDLTVAAQYLAVTYTVSLKTDASILAENSGSATVTATLNAMSPNTVSVALDHLGSATKGLDYTVSADAIVIPAGQLSASITLTATPDSLVESDETIDLTIASVTNANEDGFQQVLLTIADDDLMPTVTLSVDVSVIQENGGIATFTAELSDLSDQDVVVDLGFSGSAENGIDYLASDVQIVIYAGSSTGSITVLALDDSLKEADETVVVAITAVNDVVVASQEKQTQIADDDDAGGNQAPTAYDQSYAVKWGRDLTINLDGSDPEGSSLTYLIVEGPANGSLTGKAPSLNYISRPGFKGYDSFTFKVNDGSLDSNVATITISVTNLKPRGSMKTISTTANTETSFALDGSDSDGDNLTYTVIVAPENGSLIGTPPQLTYVPNDGFTGSDSFAYTISDGLEESDPVAVDISVDSEKKGGGGGGAGITGGGGGGGGGCVVGSTADGASFPILLFLLVLGSRLIRRRKATA